MKTVIFNVGAGLSVYAEYRNLSIVIDLGKSVNFSPVNDFLVPLFEKRKTLKIKENKGKYGISQLVISHPHKDHLADIKDFDKNFYPYLITTPNSKSDNEDGLKLNSKIIDTPDDPDILHLKNMITNRNLPLECIDKNSMELAYLYPEDVENDSELKTNTYTNNVSLSLFLKYRNYSIFLPGDIQKSGMDALLGEHSTVRNKNGGNLRELLAEGVDFLVCPHHGLKSSFSTTLFSVMKNGKTNKLNIIPEKTTNPGDGRQIDGRYQGSDYCFGNNNQSVFGKKVYSHKTSVGHLFINKSGDITQTNDIDEIIELFN